MWRARTVPRWVPIGVVLTAAFLWWETRAPAPMLPLRFFRSRGFAASNGVSFAMFFGVFGSIFLLSQFFQTVQGYSPLQAGVSLLPLTLLWFVACANAFNLIDGIDGLATGVEEAESGLASGLINTSQQVGGALGLAVLAGSPAG